MALAAISQHLKEELRKKEFSFAPPSTPAKREKRVSFREPAPSAESSPSNPFDLQSDSTAASTPESSEKANGASSPKFKNRTSPLLANVSLSLTDWLPYPSQALDNFSNTRLRWAVRTKDWQPSLREWEFMLSLLPQGDQDQIATFKFLEDRKRRLVSSLMQRKCISVALDIKWSQIRIRRTKGKKPWVVCDDVEKDHAPNFNFNVSHEGEYVVLSSEPVCICGVDVAAPRQFRGQRKQSLDKLLESLSNVFTPNEVLAMRTAGDTEKEQLNAFRRCWSLKEALGKARGDGLGMDLKRAEFNIFEEASGWKATVKINGVPKPNWRFDLLELAGGHWMSVSRGPPEDIVDAWGDFLDSLDMPNPSPRRLQDALDAPNPSLSVMQPVDLIPDHKILEYEALTGN